MTRRRPHPDQIDLLAWSPGNPVAAFAPQDIRAASLAASIAKAVSASLKMPGISREQIAERMSTYLGEQVSENMLNAYASEARAEHIINVVRFIALIDATGDRRLLQMIAEQFGWDVIDQKYRRIIRRAQRDEVIRRLQDENSADQYSDGEYPL